MRWLWLALALCIGCGGSKVSNGTGALARSDSTDAGWVIRGSEPSKILLTNGTLGVWIDTSTLQFQGGVYRMVEGALHVVPVDGIMPQVSAAANSNTWSFDLRSGELVTHSRFGGRDQTAKICLLHDRPVIAVEIQGGPSSSLLSSGGVAHVSGLIQVETLKDPTPFQLHVDKKGFIGLFANAEDSSLPSSYAEVRSESAAFHDEFWKTDIEIDGPAEDQLAIRTMLYYLRRGATPKLPPFGATNAKYRGARFWDAEAWMLPVLAIVDRQIADESTQWRLDNLRDYVPWEAAVGGKDVTPKGFGNALHVAGWVAWWTGRARDLQLLTPSEEKKALDVVFPQFYKAASDSGRGMEIKGVESPDEGKLRDNDLVTNLLAKRVARSAADHGIADGEDLEWFKSIVIPKATDGLPVTYDNDLIRGYQQTAALLAIYPLEEDLGPGVAERMFDRYADLTSEVGPAMSESIHATIAARLGRKDAYSRWRKSWQTYTDDAMMFHERRNKQDAYFMTGAAGCLQTVLFGFAGMRHADEGKESATGKLLPDGYPVAFRPSLPAEWKSITLRNIFLGPRRATVRIDRSGASIE